MFRRHWSNLPKDASFASDLKGLGYFVNEQDEIRSIEDPDCYFKFFLDKNDRINDRQRFGFHRAIETIVHERLEKRGLQKIRLPLAAAPQQPHVPIFASPGLVHSSRVVVFFGEPSQDLGVLAGRVVNGAGGINRGSMVSVVEALRGQTTSEADPYPPGIVLANMGQLHWWPEGKRALNIFDSAAIPLPSLVHAGRRFVESVNDIPDNLSPAMHVACVFNDFLARAMNACAEVDIVCIGQSCETVEWFLDKDKNWAAWGHRLNAMLLIDSVYSVENLENVELVDFLEKRTRGYLTSPEPLDTPLASPEGNPNERIPPLGCPCYSSSEPFYTETVLIRALRPALAYLRDVAVAGPGFENPPVVVVERASPQDDEAEAEAEWAAVPEEQKPSMSVVDNEAMMEELRQLRRWRKFADTGVAPESDSDELDEGGL